MQHVMQLHHSRQAFVNRWVRILLVGFEPKERAEDWIRQIQVDFPFLIDPDRSLYQDYGLQHSILQAWHPRALWFYFKRFLRGKGLPKIHADPNQLGGDVIIDQSGKIRMIFSSRDPTDRPSVEELLAVIDPMV